MCIMLLGKRTQGISFFAQKPCLHDHGHPSVLTTFPLMCSFLLQIWLLEPWCVDYKPSHISAASLSIAFGLFHKAFRPQSLQQYAAQSAQELQNCKDGLQQAQSTIQATHLRRKWCEWLDGQKTNIDHKFLVQAQAIMSQPGAI